MLFSILLRSASAAPLYEVEISIPSTPMAPSELSREMITGRLFKDVLPYPLNLSVQSTVPEIVCHASGKDVRVDISFDPYDWPNLPTFADCVYQGVTLRVFPVSDAKGTAWAMSDKTVDFNQGITLPLNPREMGYAIYDLPETLGWTGGKVQAIDEDGDPWEHVFCEVREADNNQWYLRLQVSDQPVSRGKGHCPLPSKTTAPHNLVLMITDA